MRKLLALCLCLVAFNVAAQWSNGTNLWPSSPVGIGQQAHNSIMFGVRCLDATCQGPTGPGQRGISSEVMFSEQATTYVTGMHSALYFKPPTSGSYTIPDAFRMRAIEEGTLPSGVTLTNLYGLKIYDVNKGQNNWAIWTGDGKVSLGGPTELRGVAGTRSLMVQNGSIISLYDATGAEVGRIQGASGDVVWTVISGKLNISGGVKVTSLAGSGTRAVMAQSDGSLIAP